MKYWVLQGAEIVTTGELVMIHPKKSIFAAGLSFLVAASLTGCAQEAPVTDQSDATAFEQTVWEAHTKAASDALESKDFEKAEELYKFAIQEAEKLGEGDPQLAASYNNMADFYFAQGDGEQAENMYSKSLKIKEKALGQADKDLVQDLTGLGKAFAAQGKLEDAEASFKRALEIIDSNKGQPDPEFISAYADVLRKENREGDAKEMEERLQEEPAKEAG